MPSSTAETPSTKAWPYVLTLVPLPIKPGDLRNGDQPWAGINPRERLNHLLKYAKRKCGLRCIEVRTRDPEFGGDDSERLALSALAQLLAAAPKVDRPRTAAKRKATA